MQRVSRTLDSLEDGWTSERPRSSINGENDASANFERTLFGRFSFDSQKQNMLV